MNGMMAFGLETNAEGERARIIAGSPFLFFLCYCLRKHENMKEHQSGRRTILFIFWSFQLLECYASCLGY